MSRLNEPETELYPIVIEVPYEVVRLINEVAAASELTVTELILKQLPLLSWKDQTFAKYLTLKMIEEVQGS